MLALIAVGALLPCPARADMIVCLRENPDPLPGGKPFGERFVTRLSLGLTPSLQHPTVQLTGDDSFLVYGLRAGVWMNDCSNFKPRFDVTEVSGLSVGLLSMNDRRVKGVQLSSLYSKAENISGAQLGLFNTASHVQGVQLGMLNHAAYDFCGAQAGLINSAPGKMDGLQLGVLNNAEIWQGGVQIGLVNCTNRQAQKFCLQVGLFNYAAKSWRGAGVQIGLLNRHGDFFFPLILLW